MNLRHQLPPFRAVLITACIVLAGYGSMARQKAVSLNQPLADSLRRMKDVDQMAAGLRPEQYKTLSTEAWQHIKDSIFYGHQVILDNIFNRYGFPGYDRLGKDGSHHYWLMVQHCDKMPAFQEKVLTAMEREVKKGNADAKDFAYLTDRVRLNTGRKQLYATQVTYNLDSCQALPRPTDDSLNINARRQAVGLASIESYLNDMGTMHFQMNKESYEKKGITKAKLYPVKQ